jgi:hypothetical protein
MKPDADPKLFLDEHEWRCYKRATRNLRHKQRMERVKEAEPLPWLQAVERDDAGDPVLVAAETFSVLPVELVA